jgi:hypothetical protein
MWDISIVLIIVVGTSSKIVGVEVVRPNILPCGATMEWSTVALLVS